MESIINVLKLDFQTFLLVSSSLLVIYIFLKLLKDRQLIRYFVIIMIFFILFIFLNFRSIFKGIEIYSESEFLILVIICFFSFLLYSIFFKIIEMIKNNQFLIEKKTTDVEFQLRNYIKSIEKWFLLDELKSKIEKFKEFEKNEIIKQYEKIKNNLTVWNLYDKVINKLEDDLKNFDANKLPSKDFFVDLIISFLVNQIVLVWWKPGTGKTTFMKAFFEVLEENNIRIFQFDEDLDEVKLYKNLSLSKLTEEKNIPFFFFVDEIHTYKNLDTVNKILQIWQNTWANKLQLYKVNNDEIVPFYMADMVRHSLPIYDEKNKKFYIDWWTNTFLIVIWNDNIENYILDRSIWIYFDRYIWKENKVLNNILNERIDNLLWIKKEIELYTTVNALIKKIHKHYPQYISNLKSIRVSGSYNKIRKKNLKFIKEQWKIVLNKIIKNIRSIQKTLVLTNQDKKFMTFILKEFKVLRLESKIEKFLSLSNKLKLHDKEEFIIMNLILPAMNNKSVDEVKQLLNKMKEFGISSDKYMDLIKDKYDSEKYFYFNYL